MHEKLPLYCGNAAGSAARISDCPRAEIRRIWRYPPAIYYAVPKIPFGKGKLPISLELWRIDGKIPK